MTFGTLDRKTAILWISGVALILIIRFGVLADRSPSRCYGLRIRADG